MAGSAETSVMEGPQRSVMEMPSRNYPWYPPNPFCYPPPPWCWPPPQMSYPPPRPPKQTPPPKPPRAAKSEENEGSPSPVAGNAGAGDEKRRVVVHFTLSQRALLEKEFTKHTRPTRIRRQKISQALNITQKRVNNWFQNRRIKEQKIQFGAEYEMRPKRPYRKRGQKHHSQPSPMNFYPYSYPTEGMAPYPTDGMGSYPTEGMAPYYSYPMEGMSPYPVDGMMPYPPEALTPSYQVEGMPPFPMPGYTYAMMAPMASQLERAPEVVESSMDGAEVEEDGGSHPSSEFSEDAIAKTLLSLNSAVLDKDEEELIKQFFTGVGGSSPPVIVVPFKEEPGCSLEVEACGVSQRYSQFDV